MNATAKKPPKPVNLKRMSVDAIAKLPDEVFMASITPRLRRILTNLYALKGQFKA